MYKLKEFFKKYHFYVITTFLVIVLAVLAVITNKGQKYIPYTVIAIIMDLILIYLPDRLNDKMHIWLSRILIFISPVIYFQLMEIFYKKLIFGNYTWLKLALNCLIYALAVGLVYLLTNRIRTTLIIVSVILGIYGTANWYVYEFRGIPILATDIASAKTAANVAANYSYAPTMNMLIAWLVFLGFVILVIRITKNADTGLTKRVRLGFFAIYACFMGIFVHEFYYTDKTTDNKLIVSVWDPQRSFKNTGTMLSFMLTTKYLKVDKPKDYSIKNVKELANEYISDSASEYEDTVKPNVIAIMDEAFADLKLDGDFETSQDYMPFIRNLKENTVKGTLYMSVFGGNTANSEFEFLTGNTLSFMPLRCVPYQQYVKDEMPSLTYNLKAAGYSGNDAMHPYKASGWNRPVVYPLLGFNEFITIDDFADDTKKVRKYISDEEDFKRIIEEYEKEQTDDPFYLFNVTIQNHGGYETDYDSLERTIKITDEHQNDEAERYINLANKTDMAFKELIEYFENVDEPTVIVFFGDHQPSVSNSFYNSIMKKEEDMSKAQFDMMKYQVPFVIWANYDIEEKEYKMLSANYLSALLLDTAKLPMTGYQKFLLALSEKIPVITANGYADENGNFYDRGEKSQYQDLLNDYNILEYNNVFDYKNRYSEFFFLKE